MKSHQILFGILCVLTYVAFLLSVVHMGYETHLQNLIVSAGSLFFASVFFIAATIENKKS